METGLGPFENTTLAAGVFSPDPNLLTRTCRVMAWCQDLFHFKQSVIFCHDPPPAFYSGQAIQTGIVNLNSLNAMLPMIYAALDSDTLFVHEDGFIIQPELFDPNFLIYDFIGAPWMAGPIYNNGFCWTSRAFQRAVLKLPFQNPVQLIGSDIWISETHRGILESLGIRWAPRDLALKFSTDTIGHEQPSFGFHGTKHHWEKYASGWAKIEAWQIRNYPGGAWCQTERI